MRKENCYKYWDKEWYLAPKFWQKLNKIPEIINIAHKLQNEGFSNDLFITEMAEHWGPKQLRAWAQKIQRMNETDPTGYIGNLDLSIMNYSDQRQPMQYLPGKR